MAKISFSAESPSAPASIRVEECAQRGAADLAAQQAGGGGLESVDADLETLDDERRRAGRTGVTVRIDYATVDEIFSEFTRDINEGGLFIETEKPHQPGTEVAMQFHLPGSQEVLHTLGRVVRVSTGGLGKPSGMGIEFDELTPDDRVKIDRIVRSLRSSGAP